MAYFKDLSEYVYRPECYRPGTLNVGWLDLSHEFDVAMPSEALLNGLWKYCKISVAQTRGIHECEFCSNKDVFVAERNGERLLLGSSEIRVFGGSDKIYAAPTLTYHYVERHHYRPPDEFIDAMIQAPGPLSEGYFAYLEALKLDWNMTTMPTEETVRIKPHIVELRLRKNQK